MSFPQKSFWMARDAGCLTDRDMGYDNSSRIESKRGHQWFVEGSSPELFSGKKQAIEAANGRQVPAVPPMNFSLFENTPGFQSVPGHFTDRLLGPEPARTVNMVERTTSCVGIGNMSIGRKDFENPYGSNSSEGLSISHSIEDPSSCLSFGGLRKVKVNQVRDSENGIPASIGDSYGRSEIGTTYGKNDNIISLGPTYNRDGNSISVGSAFNKMNDDFVSVGHAFDKGDGNFISVGHNYSKGDSSILSMGQPFSKGDEAFISMGQSYGKVDGNVISLGTSYNKVPESFISIGSTFSKGNENFISMASAYNKGNSDSLSMGPTFDKVGSDIVDPNYDKGDTGAMGQTYDKGENNTISFGSFDDEPGTNDPSGGIISSYDLLMNGQNSAQAPDVTTQKSLVDSNADQNAYTSSNVDSRLESTAKNKEPKSTKKVPPNSFPSNVKALLSTGMLDGVPVKYVSWSRDTNLKGIIKGTGYLCCCDKCDSSKALNAYEFERHAGCKTKHPNNHIYFENGKTIYAVVQELKSTPQEMLFDAIQTVTGSPINQKNFRVWKASYQAATRELQRIYGKDEVIMPS